MCVLVQFLWEKGVRPGLVVDGEGRGPRFCACDDLSMTTHPPQLRSFELDRQETSATEVCESSFSPCKLVQAGPCEEGAPKFA